MDQVWMNPSPTVTSCHDRPKILEFLVHSDLQQIQYGGTKRTYYALFAFATWIDWHHIFYTKPSNAEYTYINFDHLQAALDAIWSGDNLVKTTN